MRQDDRTLTDLARIIQQIQVEAAGRVGNGTSAPQSRFDLMQKCHESKGLEAGADLRHSIDETGLPRVGPSLGLVKGRNRDDFDTGAGQFRQRRFESPGRRSGQRRNICTQADEYRATA